MSGPEQDERWGELMRLLSLETDALSLYAVAHLEGEVDPDTCGALRARLREAGDELARAILRVLLRAGVAPGELLAEVLDGGGDAARVAALQAIEGLPAAELDPLVTGKVRSATDEGVRSALLGALGRVEGPLPEVLAGEVREHLGDADARVRANAAECLGARAGAAAVEDLLPLLDDPVPRVRAAAAKGVFSSDPSRVTARVRADLSTGDARTVLAALHVVGEVAGFPEAGALLMTRLRDPDGQVRLMAARSLGSRAGELPAGELAEAYLAENLRPCRVAIGRLAQAGARRDFCRALGEVLADASDPRGRAGAAQGIGEAGTEEDEDLLVGHVQDADDRVRAEVIESLGRIGSSRVDPILEHAVLDPANRVAANAALALWRRGGATCLATLAAWLRGEDPGRARSAAFALGEIGSVEVVGPLLEVAEGLRDRGAVEEGERELLKQIMKALTRVQSGVAGGP